MAVMTMADFNVIRSFRIAAMAAMLILAIRLAPPQSASAQASGPELVVGAALSRPGGNFEVPVTFRGRGHQVATLLFSLDLDTSRVTMNGGDADGDDVPDAIRVGLPAVFQPMVSYDAADTDGELDVLITGMQAPLPAMPDGTVLTLTLSSKAGVAGNLGSAVTFASQPAASFGSTTGQSVMGVVIDARTAAATPAPPAPSAGSASAGASPIPGGPAGGARTPDVPPAGSSGGSGSSGTGRHDIPPLATPVGGAAGSAASGAVGAATTATSAGAGGTAASESSGGAASPGESVAGRLESAMTQAAGRPDQPITGDSGQPASQKPSAKDQTQTEPIPASGLTGSPASSAGSSGPSGRLLAACAILAVMIGSWVWRRRRASEDV